MAKKIIVNVIPEEIRMALSEDGRLLEVAVERTESDYMVGNIYKGRVENVLPGMQAAFINIGIGKNAFLYAGDIFPHKSFQRLVEEDNLTVGAEIMVEIVKEAMGTKGPRATTHFSIPGRYVVVMPSVDYVGVSRRIESGEERHRLRALAEKIRPKGMGVIVRTVAEGHSEEELSRDFQYLSNLWNALTAKSKRAKAPFLLYRDADLIVRIIRDHVKDDIDEVIIDDAEAHARMVELAKFISPDLVKKIHLYKAKTEIFTHFAIEEEWNRLADRRVDLKCGGYLIIDKTEALTVIDVNTGRFIGNSNLADTVFRANMEAAAEIARQLRLRDIGGIIVADFIDMQKDSHKKAVLLELEACLKADNTKTNVLGLTELGLVEMTRKKARQTYEGTLYEGCPCCGGRGIIQSPDTLVISIRRQLRRVASKRPGADLVVQVHPRIAERFGDKKSVSALEKELGIDLTVETIESMQPEVYAIFEGDKALVRSNEPKKTRKQAPRRLPEGADDTCGIAEPLSEEELAPLLAEKFAMERVVDPASTLEARLAAMAGSLWEPLLEEEDEEEPVRIPVTSGTDDAKGEVETKSPRRRRRSKKMTMTVASEILPGKSEASDSFHDVSVDEDRMEPSESIAPDETAKEKIPAKKTRRRRKTKKQSDVEPLLPGKEENRRDEALSAELVATGSGTPEIAEPAAEEAPNKPKRKRRRKKKPVKDDGAAETIDVATASIPAEAEGKPRSANTDSVDVTQELPEKSMDKSEEPGKKVKRRRRRKKKPLVASDDKEAALTETAEKEPEDESSDLSALPEQTGADENAEIPAKKSKRRRRRRKPAGIEGALKTEEAANLFATAAEIPGEPEIHGAEKEENVPVLKKKRRRRRSNGKKKASEGTLTSTNPDESD